MRKVIEKKFGVVVVWVLTMERIEDESDSEELEV